MNYVHITILVGYSESNHPDSEEIHQEQERQGKLGMNGKLIMNTGNN
jgi:hypothetical protein